MRKELNLKFEQAFTLIFGFYSAFLTVGCGGAVPQSSIDPAFGPYVQRFQTIAAQHGKTVHTDRLVVRFGTLSAGKLGNCTIDPQNPPTVVLSTDYWRSMSDDDKEQLVNHELGHCLLGQAHRDDQVFDEDLHDYRPASIMSTTHFSGSIYRAHKEQYYEEEFGHASTGSALSLNPSGVAVRIED